MKVIKIINRGTREVIKATPVDRPDFQINKIVLLLMTKIDLKNQEIIVEENSNEIKSNKNKGE